MLRPGEQSSVSHIWVCVLCIADQISKMNADAEAQAELEELRGLTDAKSNRKPRQSVAVRRRSKVRQAQQQQNDDGEQVGYQPTILIRVLVHPLGHCCTEP